MKSILKIKKWKTVDDIVEFCNHIISHKEQYTKECVFEAKELLNNYQNL